MTLATSSPSSVSAGSVRSPSPERLRTSAEPPGWTGAYEQALQAVAARLLDGAPDPSGAKRDTVIDVKRRIATLPAHKCADLLRVLALLGSRAVALVTVGRAAPFATLPAAVQDRWLTTWAHSSLPPLRSAHQALRRLVLGAHYAHAAVARSIGCPGPLHTRTPAVAWEGPLPGVASDSDPVARGSADLRPRLPQTVPPSGVVPGDQIPPAQHRTADVVVIGTGAGGAVAAARLAEAGLEVVLLEEGSWYGAADFTEDEGSLAEQLYADGAARATDDLGVQLLQGRAVGGSTTINWLIMLRTPEFVLDEWVRDHGLTDFSASAMAPVFDRVEREVHARRVPDDAHSPNNRLVLDGAKALGWRASSALINAKGCVRSGFCGVGCRYDAKQSTLVTFVPRALAAGATLYTNTRAERLEVRDRDSGGALPRKRVHATVLDRTTGATRGTLTVDAPLVICAGGAVGTPVLLQRSGMGGGGVGRYLRLHPTTAVIARYDQDIVGSSGIPLSTMCDEHLRWNDSDYGFWIECPPLLPALGAVATPGFGQAHATTMAAFRRLGTLIALTRDGADRRASSGRVLARRDGGTSIAYALTAADAARVRASIAASVELSLAAGAREVHTLHAPSIVVRNTAGLAQVRTAPVSANRVGLFSAHVNGTCRMGVDPATSGTTPDGERHGVRGVYVCDGSLLPTALGVNPQETIMALATVLSERLASRHGTPTTTTGAEA